MTRHLRPFGAACAAAVLLAACVEVPDTVRAAFAPAAPGDPSNYRIGPHGSAPPVDVGAAIIASASLDAATEAGPELDAAATAAEPHDAGHAAADTDDAATPTSVDGEGGAP
jgi:hypothetical protein